MEKSQRPRNGKGSTAGAKENSNTAYPSIWKCSTTISTVLSVESVSFPVSRVGPCQAQFSMTGLPSTLTRTPSSLKVVNSQSPFFRGRRVRAIMPKWSAPSLAAVTFSEMPRSLGPRIPYLKESWSTWAETAVGPSASLR